MLWFVLYHTEVLSEEAGPREGQTYILVPCEADRARVSQVTCLRLRGDGVAGLSCRLEEAGRHLHGEVGDEGFPG